MNKTQNAKLNDIVKMLNGRMLGYSVNDCRVLISEYMVIKSLDIDFTCFTKQSLFEGDFNNRFYNRFNDIAPGASISTGELIEFMKGFNNKDHVVQLVSEGNKLTLIVIDIKQGEILQSMELQFEGKPMKLTFNLKWFKKICELIKAFDGNTNIELKYTSGVQPVLLTSPSFNIVLAPIRMTK